MEDLYELQKREQELIEIYKEKDPGLFTAQRSYTPHDLMRQIGILVDFGYQPQGYLNYYNQDFIVEEIDRDGTIRTIEPQGAVEIPAPPANGLSLYADLVKAGLSTLEAVNDLAKAFGIKPTQIDYAGLKDKMAVTGQRLSFKEISYGQLKDNLLPQGMFLKNFQWAEGNTYKGNLQGNRFVIIIRTPMTLGEGWLKSALAQVRGGFCNFYYVQRFGTGRPISHILGRCLLQKNYEKALRIFLTDCTMQDTDILNKIRKQAEQNFGDWKMAKELFNKLPYTFRLEIDLIEHLENNPTDYLGALKTIHDQVQMWVYAYASYLFNLHLSKLINEKKAIPKRLPLLLNPKYADVDTYVEQLEADGISDLASISEVLGKNVMRFENTCATKRTVKIIQARIIKKGVILAFTLPIGSYATTFLSHLFILDRGLPVPEWVDGVVYDSKKIVGLGSIEETKELLGDFVLRQIVEARGE